MPSRSSRTGPTRRRAQSNVQTAISKYPDAGVFLGLWSYNAHFIAEEVAKFPDLRKKVTIVTFDLDEAAVDDLAKGAIDVTVCQNPYQMGYLGVRLLKAFITKDQKTIDEMLPGRHRQHRYRRARDRAQERLAGQGRQRDRHRRNEEVAGEQGAEVVVRQRGGFAFSSVVVAGVGQPPRPSQRVGRLEDGFRLGERHDRALKQTGPKTPRDLGGLELVALTG